MRGDRLGRIIGQRLRQQTLADDELAPLPKQVVIALQLAQMLGDAWPRRADDAGNVLVTERNLQQSAASIFDTKVVAKVEHRDCDAIVEIEVKQPGAAQKQPVPVLQVVLMELPKGRFATIDGDALEAIPLHHSDAAIVVGFTAKIKTVGRKCRELR